MARGIRSPRKESKSSKSSSKKVSKKSAPRAAKKSPEPKEMPALHYISPPKKKRGKNQRQPTKSNRATTRARERAEDISRTLRALLKITSIASDPSRDHYIPIKFLKHHDKRCDSDEFISTIEVKGVSIRAVKIDRNVLKGLRDQMNAIILGLPKAFADDVKHEKEMKKNVKNAEISMAANTVVVLTPLGTAFLNAIAERLGEENTNFTDVQTDGGDLLVRRKGILSILTNMKEHSSKEYESLYKKYLAKAHPKWGYPVSLVEIANTKKADKHDGKGAAPTVGAIEDNKSFTSFVGPLVRISKYGPREDFDGDARTFYGKSYNGKTTAPSIIKAELRDFEANDAHFQNFLENRLVGSGDLKAIKKNHGTVNRNFISFKVDRLHRKEEKLGAREKLTKRDRDFLEIYDH